MNRPEYQTHGELIATMKEVVHRIEQWMNEAVRVAKEESRVIDNFTRYMNVLPLNMDTRQEETQRFSILNLLTEN